MAACDKFIYIENLRPAAPAEAGAPDAAPAATRRATAAQLKRDAGLIGQLRSAVEAGSDDDGWAPLGQVGTLITKQQPDFDSRNYGYAKLSDLMTATTLFELERRSAGPGRPGAIYVRDRRRAPAKKTTAQRSSAR